MKFSKEEYIKLTERFNALPFPDQIQRVIDNPNILEMHIVFKFKGIDPNVEDQIPALTCNNSNNNNTKP